MNITNGLLFISYNENYNFAYFWVEKYKKKSLFLGHNINITLYCFWSLFIISHNFAFVNNFIVDLHNLSSSLVEL